MATGTYEFTVPVAGLRLEQTEVANSHPSVEKIVIETQDDERMSIVFHLTDIFTETEVDAITKYKQINSEECRMRAKEEPVKSIRIPTLDSEQLTELEEFYRTTREARLRTRAQMVLLAVEQRLVAEEIAGLVRSSEETVRRWLKRYLAEGVEGLRDVPHPGAPRKVTDEYRERLVQAVRRRPRSLGLPFSLWTLRRLAEHMAEQTGIRVEYETVRLHLKAEGIVLSRPQHTITSPDPEYALKKRR